MLVFVDSNILFSTCYRSPNLFERLWTIPGLRIATSHYCVTEVRRHLGTASQIENFHAILERTQIVEDCPEEELPATLMLHAKDVPVLAAAARCHAEVLVTGDKNHFGRYFGHRVLGVRIESPEIFRTRYPKIFQR
jgi:predicted nucleic acid-binding protein